MQTNENIYANAVESYATSVPGMYGGRCHIEIFFTPNKEYYYWYCFPGCLPDSEPIGPFENERNLYQELQNEHGPF